MKSKALVDESLDFFLPVVDPAVQQLHDSTACFTKDAVVDGVLDQLNWPATGGKLLDPGAGDGAFMVRSIERMTLVADDIDALAKRIVGWEIHPVAASMARERIIDALRAKGWSDEASDNAAVRILVEADFLAPGPRVRDVTHVAGNPPYLRFGNLPKFFKDLYMEMVPEYARGDILHAFLDRAADVLLDEGHICVVTADRWLFNENASKLRERIGERFGVAGIKRLSVDSAFYRAKTRRVGTPPRVHPVVVTLSPRAAAERPLTRDPIYPEMTVAVPEHAQPLGDVATVRLAPWLGSHGVFTVDATDAAHLPAELLVPCVDTDDVVAGEIAEPTRYAIRTEKGVEPHPLVKEHLLRTVEKLPPRAQRDMDKPNWWLPSESWGAFPLEEDALLIPRIAKGIKPIRLPAGLLPINHNLTVVSNVSGGIDVLIDALLAPHVQAWIEAHAPRLENGFYSITTNLLRRMPVVLGAEAALEQVA